MTGDQDGQTNLGHFGSRSSHTPESEPECIETSKDPGAQEMTRGFREPKNLWPSNPLGSQANFGPLTRRVLRMLKNWAAMPKTASIRRLACVAPSAGWMKPRHAG